MPRKLIYIASPYTVGDKEMNVYHSMGIGSELMDAGLCPVMPLLSHYFDQYFPHEYEEYMQVSFALIERCDAVLRLPGQSSGADRECLFATQRSIPVFFNIDNLLEGCNHD